MLYSFSVLIHILSPVRNEGPRIERMINSVLSQTEVKFKLIIADNSSNDGTADIAEAVAGGTNSIQIWRYPEPSVNAIANWNRAVSRLFETENVRYIIFLAGDDFFYSDNLLQILYSHLQSGQFDVAFPSYRNSRWKDTRQADQRFSRIVSNTSLNRFRMTWCHEYFHLTYSLVLREVFLDCWTFASRVSGGPNEKGWWFTYKLFEYRIKWAKEVIYVHTDEKQATDLAYNFGEYYWPEANSTQTNSTHSLGYFDFEKRLLKDYWQHRNLVSSSVVILIGIQTLIKFLRRPYIKFLWWLRRNKVKNKFDRIRKVLFYLEKLGN